MQAIMPQPPIAALFRLKDKLKRHLREPLREPVYQKMILLFLRICGSSGMMVTEQNAQSRII